MSLSIFGFDLFKVHWWHILYVIVALVVTVGGTQRLYPYGMGRSVIFAIGAVLVFYFFDQRWFGTQPSLPVTWPPTVNMCPDFLTFIPNVPGSESLSGGVCVDLLGVTSKAGGIEKTTKSQLANISAKGNNVFTYTAKDITQAKAEEICNGCRIAGVTWEGVYDGDNCMAITTGKNKAEAQAKCNEDISKELQRVKNSFYG